jgi:hypothetical protein
LAKDATVLRGEEKREDDGSRKQERGKKSKNGFYHEADEEPSAARAATETRNISRKDAKAAKVGKMNRMVCKIINLSVPKLGVLCALAGVNPRVRVFQINAKFARAAQNLSHSGTKLTIDNNKIFVTFALFVPSNGA